MVNALLNLGQREVREDVRRCMLPSVGRLEQLLAALQ